MSVYFEILIPSVIFKLYDFWSRMGLWPESDALLLGERGKTAMKQILRKTFGSLGLSSYFCSSNKKKDER
jgi:hypothetical protein